MNRRERRASRKFGQPSGGTAPAAASPGPVAALFAAGVAHHEAGRLGEAEAAYRRVLAVQPDHADALHFMGVLAQQAGRPDAAADLIGQAIRHNGRNPLYFFNLGTALRGQGKLDEAIAAYRQVTRMAPGFAQGHYNLGVALYDNGALDLAITAFRDALRIDANLVVAHYNLGTALRVQGKLDDAIAACRQAIRINPNFAEAHCNLAKALNQQGHAEDAVAAYRHAIHLKPDYAQAHSGLGLALAGQGKFDAAIAAYGEAIRLQPDDAETHSNLGNALKEQGRLEEAAAAFAQAIRLAPNFAEAHYNLGVARVEQGRIEEAVAVYARAIAVRPGYAEAHSNLAVALAELGRLDEAVTACRDAIRIKPDFAAAHSNLGMALTGLGKLEAAVAACREAIRIKPDFAESYCNLGNALVGQARIDDAAAAYRQAVAVKPSYAGADSNLLLCLNYDDRIGAAALFREHREWDRRHGRTLPRLIAAVTGRDPARRLKVGYVSADLQQHSVANFLEPLLCAHDRTAIEVLCYAEVTTPDAVTARFEVLADHWVPTVGTTDAALAERVRQDGIDILVDLSGHTAKNRLGVFARRPAPIGVTWLGYPNTTGLEAIDYRLVDAVTDPEGEADAFASETLVRLPGGFLCYGGPLVGEAPEPAAPPSLAAGSITFGSFNNPAKLSAMTLDVWAKLLERLPQARLFVKGKSFADAGVRAALLAALGKRGVAPERVELVATVPGWAAHMALYDRIDIALDPFPYNGTTTTCEALWMGVPVVTLLGDRHAGRVGASLLGQVGLPELIAGSPEAYVETAVALAGDTVRLRELRRSLRPRMASSPLRDAAGFARKIEHAYRVMWRRWCEAPRA